ncbi:MAG: SDR family NAD(P)-dependent oxidoreductase [Pseudomonadota bacterium]
MMHSLGQSYHAVVIGASGGIGGAMARLLAEDGACAGVHAFSRSGSAPEHAKINAGRLDLTDDTSIAVAAETVPQEPTFIVVATGFLHDGGAGPEKSWSQITPDSFAHNFAINTTGPALVARHFLDRFPRRERCIFAALSARVGSISDNKVGGWYGYRASKAALNQVLKCLAIEGARKRKHLVVAGLQPGTVRTALSEPFRGGVSKQKLFEPEDAARHLLGVLDGLEPQHSGRMFDWRGDEVPP